MLGALIRFVIFAIVLVMGVAPPALALPDVGEYTESRPATTVTPAGDLDGDGRADTIATRQTTNAFVIEGRRGFDGAPLWHHVLPGSVSASGGIWPGARYLYSFPTGISAVYPARVGPDGENGVIVRHLVETGASAVVGLVAGGGTRQYEMRLSAISGNGSRLWERRFPIVVTPAGGTGFSDLAEPFDAVEGPADDLAVAIAGPAIAGQVTTLVVVLDGATGLDAARFGVPWRRPVHVAPAADLDADGLQDLLLTLAGDYPATAGSVQAYRRDGERLWKTAVNGIDSEPEFAPLGDVSGDGVADLHIADQRDFVSYDDSGVLDGATGDWLTREPSSHLVAVPDLNADGAIDLVEQDAGYRSVTYRATTVGGAPIYSSTYAVTNPYLAFSDIGDVDGDGVRDRVHTAYSGNNPDSGTSTVVSLRTGTALWSGPGVRATGVTLDGSGADLVRLTRSGSSVTVTGVDGLDGSALWTRTFASTDVGFLRGLLAFDPDGDGIGEVILQHFVPGAQTPWPLQPVIEYTTSTSRHGSVVLAGADGATRWQL